MEHWELPLVGLKGSVQTEKCVMVAQSIHMQPRLTWEEGLGVHDGQARFEGQVLEEVFLANTAIRVTAQSQLKCHLSGGGGNKLSWSGSLRGTYPLPNYIGSSWLKWQWTVIM